MTSISKACAGSTTLICKIYILLGWHLFQYGQECSSILLNNLFENFISYCVLNSKPLCTFRCQIVLRVWHCTSIFTAFAFVKTFASLQSIPLLLVVLFGLPLFLLPRSRSLYIALGNLWSGTLLWCPYHPLPLFYCSTRQGFPDRWFSDLVLSVLVLSS